jgi:flavin reductase (DIM6/NTAB) family NADH-FMN oxidoreductase RutF
VPSYLTRPLAWSGRGHDEQVRVEVDPDEVAGSNDFYRLLNSVVIPRPIAWVSTRSAEGVDNLAPHSFFTVASVSPPIVQFTSVGRKDSLTNAEATGELVINFAPEWLFEQVNATGTTFPAEVDEFEAVGVTREPSARVTPWRVAGSPVALECVLHATLRLGDCTLVFGRVVLAAIEESVLDEGHPVAERLAPLARLGRDEWSTLGQLRHISRIPYPEWPGHYRHDT